MTTDPIYDRIYDIAIIGGGINGAGIARDAAGRGLKTALFEQADLAQATSSASTKLIHGGLRYLEHYEFRLVREALLERETLLGIAPHIIWPLRFILPHHKGLRPAWLLRLGLFLYDHLGGRKILPATQKISLRNTIFGAPLQSGFSFGFEYSDCWVDDARLVILNAKDAADHGADIFVRTCIISAQRHDDLWLLEALMPNGITQSYTARRLVNATGPWVADTLKGALRINSAAKVRQVKGSHIIVPKIFDHDHAYIFQNKDGRIIFAIPYEQDFTLIGTTDLDFHDDPSGVKIAQDEIDYLCSAASEYFAKPIRQADIVWTYSGVRPLYDDGATQAQEATRDYVLTCDAPAGQAPLLSVFGGKITTYRRLAEAALDALGIDAAYKGWTGQKPLPGGDFSIHQKEDYIRQLQEREPRLTRTTAERWLRTYGMRAFTLLFDAHKGDGLGRCFGADLHKAEIDYLMREEWAHNADDILWRRTKLGLRLDTAQIKHLQDYIDQQRAI